MTDIIDQVLVREGWPQITSDPDDRGGLTKGGITLNTLSLYLGRDATEQDIKDLSRDTAREIYQKIFIDRPGFNQILDQEVREYLVDCGVMHGPMRVARWLQTMLKLRVDGHLGPVTAGAVNQVAPGKMLNRIIAWRVKMIGRDVTTNLSQVKYLDGWLSRAVEKLEE